MTTGLFLACVLLVLSGCSTSVSWKLAEKQLGQIFVESIPERQGQLFRQWIRQRLGTFSSGTSSRYTLKVDIQESEDTLSMGTDGRGAMYRITTTVAYRLIDAGTQKVVTENRLSSVGSYFVLSRETETPEGAAYYSTCVSKDFTRQVNLHNLVELLVNELLSFFESTHRCCPGKKPSDPLPKPVVSPG